MESVSLCSLHQDLETVKIPHKIPENWPGALRTEDH